MKNIFVFLLSFCFIQANAQTDDAKLNARLKEYMQLNRDLKFHEIMDYMHPNLFKLAPREMVEEMFEKAFDNEAIKITIDTLTLGKGSPLFKHDGASYYKIDYYMVMGLGIKDKEALADSSFSEMMTEQLTQMYGTKRVTYDPKTALFKIAADEVLIAIKDNEEASWLFLGYDAQKSEILSTLFPAAVIDHFKLK